MKELLCILVLSSALSAIESRATPATIEALRHASRDRVISNELHTEPGPHDQVENLVEGTPIRNLQELEERKLSQARLPSQPWSDFYWPFFGGVLAYRYADPEFPGSHDWKKNQEYILGHLDQAPIAHRSPAEKYDLLIGDTGYGLTRAMLNEGAGYYERTGKVEAWMGICHGWAPASFMEARPTRSVQVRGAFGDLIEFHPSDIKALTSLLWANSEAPTRFIGGRCNDQDPTLNRDGRPTSEDCLDNNPGSWHLAVVNQIGIAQRSFIIDASWNYEVWNQPVVGYQYELFDVITGETRADFLSARVQLRQHRKDPYRKHRSERAMYLVGVRMTVEYMVETQPTAAKRNSEANDRSQSATYEYDLELDANGEIIGGEWHDNFHPDFLWTPVSSSLARSFGDRVLDREGDRELWLAGEALPKSWRRAARFSVSHQAPLARIVRRLIELSNL